jgi:hypothetical protein
VGSELQRRESPRQACDLSHGKRTLNLLWTALQESSSERASIQSVSLRTLIFASHAGRDRVASSPRAGQHSEHGTLVFRPRWSHSHRRATRHSPAPDLRSQFVSLSCRHQPPARFLGASELSTNVSVTDAAAILQSAVDRRCRRPEGPESGSGSSCQSASPRHLPLTKHAANEDSWGERTLGILEWCPAADKRRNRFVHRDGSRSQRLDDVAHHLCHACL